MFLLAVIESQDDANAQCLGSVTAPDDRPDDHPVIYKFRYGLLAGHWSSVDYTPIPHYLTRQNYVNGVLTRSLLSQHYSHGGCGKIVRDRIAAI